MPDFDWQVFISHASEDKDAIARPLANHLAALGVKVWLDESELRLGDSLRTKIDAGLAKSRFGVVILSPSFFAKNWTKAELDGLIARESNGLKVVLPIWHNVKRDEVEIYSPILAGRLAASTDEGLAKAAKEILAVIEDQGPRSDKPKPIFAGRLTKKALFDFPEGSFLLSNIYNPDMTPRLAEPIPPVEQRATFWRKLVGDGIAKTRVYVFKDASSYRAHMAARDIYVPEGSRPHTDALPITFDIEVVRALIAAGRSPPDDWAPFVKVLYFEDEKYRFKDLRGFKNLTKLEHLDLYDVAPDNLEPLAGLKSLKWLYLSDSESSDISALSHLVGLEYLDINMTRVADVRPLGKLKNLKHLNLFSKELVDVSPLRELRQLEYLNLSMSRVKDLSPLGSLHKLQILYLTATPVENINPLADLCSLKSLCLWKTRVADLGPLAFLTELRTLDVDETDVRSVAPLRNLRKLRFISAHETNVADLSILKGVPNLEISLRNERYSGLATIDIRESWEVWYWTRRFSISEAELQSLITAYGDSAAVIQRVLHNSA
jgi:hypothetical protein